MSKEGEHCYEYPRPSVTVDAAIIAKPAEGKPAKLLLIQRKKPPCQGQWALPGGFVDENEPLDHAAARELKEETSLDASQSGVVLEQIGAFGDPGRDPRSWCVTVAYAALVPSGLDIEAADDAEEAEWFDVRKLPSKLAFDHKVIVRTAFEHLLKEHAGTGELAESLRAGVEQLQGDWERPKE
ncbi:g9612 [Coccomyxa viridis]|uniref:G9612 protein n=1 Tax=Coccomyxa viridis TaxID=1274662 RepID=A0ABP1G3S2_9CHLO